MPSPLPRSHSSPSPAPNNKDEGGEQSRSYKEQASQFYNRQYETWAPWLEDQYLKWFTKENKASYATKEQLHSTTVETGIPGVTSLQNDIHNTIGNQLGQGGLGEGLGNAVSKEGFNRAERGGKDENGSYGVGGVGESVSSGLGKTGEAVGGGVKGAGGYIGEGVKGVGGLFGGGGSGKK